MQKYIKYSRYNDVIMQSYITIKVTSILFKYHFLMVCVKLQICNIRSPVRQYFSFIIFNVRIIIKNIYNFKIFEKQYG